MLFLISLSPQHGIYSETTQGLIVSSPCQGSRSLFVRKSLHRRAVCVTFSNPLLPAAAAGAAARRGFYRSSTLLKFVSSYTGLHVNMEANTISNININVYI